MMTLNDGRSELWQWDTGRTINAPSDCSQVHFSNKVFGRSIDVDVIDGVANIPDILLQTDKELTAWAFVGTPENGYTKISKEFKVNRRNKPADYVFTPTEQTTLGELVERLEKIEETQDPDAIKNAVDDYLASNPIQIDEKDPTVSNWAKKPTKPSYTAEEVGALPSDTVIPVVPEALPNPHPLRLTGAVEATYDGSEAVEVEIPQGGGGSEWQTILDDTATVEDVAQITASLNASKFEEYRAVIFIGNNTNTEAAVNGNVTIHIDGHMVSYYTIANNFDNNRLIVVAHVETSPIVAGLHQSSTGSEKIAHTYVWKTTSPYHSSCAERKDMLCIKNENRVGKLHIEMPAAYSGTVRYKILARK